MRRVFVVYCHPREDSFTAAVRDEVLAVLDRQGAEVRVSDLYATGFSPTLSIEEHGAYLSGDTSAVANEVESIKWCDTLIFVYPTWWYGLPAVLKGWLDRVLLPGVAFLMPQAEGETIRPNLTHIQRLGVFTTCGASRWLTLLVGSPGKRTLTRGIGFLCAPRRRTAFAAHYLMDSSTDDSRAAHLDRVRRRLERLLK